jgi:hypothetical protein
MHHYTTRNVEGWCYFALCLSVVLCAALWTGWRLVQIAHETASLPPVAHAEAAPPAAPPVPAPATPTPEPWYVVKPLPNGAAERTYGCALAQADDQPAAWIKRFSRLQNLFGHPFEIHDITEHGVVVQTTLVWQGLGIDIPCKFYRGKQRCEQNHQAMVDAEDEARRVQHQQEEQQLKKYR